MNRLRHAESYKFTLELETSLTTATDQTSGALSTQIVRSPAVPSVFYSDFDNFDQSINKQSGGTSIHSAQGITLRELEVGEKSNPGGSISTMPFSQGVADALMIVPLKKICRTIMSIEGLIPR